MPQIGAQARSEPLSEEIRRGRNRLAATVVLGHAVKHIYNSGLHSVLLAVLKNDLGLSGAQFGLLSTSGEITSGATTMVAGYLGDRFANRSGVMLMISLGMMGISYYLLGTAPNYWLMFAAMLFVGIGPSLYHSPAIATLSRKFPDKRSFAISWHGTGGSVGEVVGPILTGGAYNGDISCRLPLERCAKTECRACTRVRRAHLPDDARHPNRERRDRIAARLLHLVVQAAAAQGDAGAGDDDCAAQHGTGRDDGVPAGISAGGSVDIRDSHRACLWQVSRLWGYWRSLQWASWQTSSGTKECWCLQRLRWAC